MGPKLINCGKPEQVGTKECGKMLKRIQVLEDAGSLARRLEIGRLKDKRKELLGRHIRDCYMSLRWGDSRNERGQKLLEIFRQGENEVYIARLARRIHN